MKVSLLSPNLKVSCMGCPEKELPLSITCSPLQFDFVQCVPTFGYWVLRVVPATLKKIYSFANGISRCIWWETVMKYSKGYGLLRLIKCS